MVSRTTIQEVKSEETRRTRDRQRLANAKYTNSGQNKEPLVLFITTFLLVLVMLIVLALR